MKMKNVMTSLIATSAITLASAAFALESDATSSAKVKQTENGGYEAEVSSKNVNTAGTLQTSETDIDVNVDDEGRVEHDVTRKALADPKGLMNKKTSVTESILERKGNGGYKRVDMDEAKDASGTNIKTKQTVNVDHDSDGNVTKRVETSKTVDPKGLLNAKTTTTTSKMLNGKLVSKNIDN